MQTERQHLAGKRRGSGVKGAGNQAFLNAPRAFIASKMLAFLSFSVPKIRLSENRNEYNQVKANR